MEFHDFWRGLTHHGTYCYFGAFDMTGINRKTRSRLKHPHLEVARRPVAHRDEIAVSAFGELPDEDSSIVEENEKKKRVILNDASHPISKKELNDLVPNPSLSQSSTDLLPFRRKKNPLRQ